MGCSTSLMLHSNDLKTSGHNKTTLTESEITITSREKYFIKKTWKNLSKNMPGIGAKIFLFIFTKYPHIKQIFPCRNIEGEALLRDPDFRGHASRFMQAVGAAVDNIDDLEAAMTPLLFSLGQQHIHFKGFEMNYFDAFVEAIMDIFKGEMGSRFSPDVSRAWMVIFRFIQQTLKEGYQDAIQKANRP